MIFIKNGEYSDLIKPSKSGSSGLPINYKAFTSHSPVLTDPPGGVSINLDGLDYIEVDGITFDGKGVYDAANINKWITMNDSNHNTIQNSTFKFAKGWACVELNGGAKYNKLLNNSFFTCGELGEIDRGDLLMIKCATNNLVEGNKFERGGHNLFDVAGGYNILRYNTFDNRWSNTHGNRSGDLSGNTKYCTSGIKGYNVFEFNTIMHTLGAEEDPEPMSMKVQGVNQIVRNNIYYDNGFYSLASAVRMPEIPESWNHKIVHNVFLNNGNLFEIRDYGNDGRTDNIIFKNNIISGNTDSNHDIYANIKISAAAAGNNNLNQMRLQSNAFDKSGGTKFNVKGIGFQGLDWYETNHTQDVANNIQNAPIFVGTTFEKLDDFRQAEGSPMIDAGSHLTQVSENGSGSTIKVEDAGYFHNGFGVAESDSIQVGLNKPARIMSIDYSNNTITVEDSLTWNKGDGVSLPYTGQAPDIGAFEFDTGEKAAPSSPDITEVNEIKVL